MSLGLAFPDGAVFRLVPRSVGLAPITVATLLAGAPGDVVYEWHEMGMKSPQLQDIMRLSAEGLHRLPCESHC